MKVSDILRVKGGTLFTVAPEQQLADAVNVMSSHDIGSLVVMEHALEHAAAASCDRTQAGPEKAVVNDEEIHAVVDGLVPPVQLGVEVHHRRVALVDIL